MSEKCIALGATYDFGGFEATVIRMVPFRFFETAAPGHDVSGWDEACPGWRDEPVVRLEYSKPRVLKAGFPDTPEAFTARLPKVERQWMPRRKALEMMV